MHYHWLIKNRAEDLIVFFNGWSLDEKPFRFLTSSRFDVLVLYDYRSLDIPQELSASLQPYKEFFLVAYSMGVWVSQRFLSGWPDTPAYSLAINGTLNPIDDRYGIPTKSYNDHISSFNPDSMSNFYRSLFPDTLSAQKFMANLPERNWQDQLEELVRLKEHIHSDPLDKTYGHFDSALISSQDMIISARNQSRFWKNQSNYRIIDAGHFPFYRWSSWEDIIHEAQAR